MDQEAGIHDTRHEGCDCHWLHDCRTWLRFVDLVDGCPLAALWDTNRRHGQGGCKHQHVVAKMVGKMSLSMIRLGETDVWHVSVCSKMSSRKVSRNIRYI